MKSERALAADPDHGGRLVGGPDAPPSSSPIHGLYRRLVTLFVSTTATSMLLGIPFYIFGVDLTMEQMRLAAGLIIPIAALVTFLTGYRVLVHDFRPFRAWLDSSSGNIDRMTSEMLVCAFNFPLLSARRILLFHGSVFALVIGILILMANHFLDFKLHLWQMLVAMMASFMVAIGHAMFEYYAVSSIMEPVIVWLKRNHTGQSMDRQRIIPITMKRKLLLVSGLVVFMPLLVLGVTLLIKFQNELNMLAMAQQATFMPKLTGWAIAIITVGSCVSLMISMQMAREITGSANKLSRAMRQVQDGSLEASLVPTSTDEFADIFEHSTRW